MKEENKSYSESKNVHEDNRMKTKCENQRAKLGKVREMVERKE